MNEILVSQPVDEQFLESIESCRLPEDIGFRQIGDARADALADIGDRLFRIVLTSDSGKLFFEQYREQAIDCIGELPPFNTIFILARSARTCDLVEDLSDRARSYGMNYSSVMIEMIMQERSCN